MIHSLTPITGANSSIWVRSGYLEKKFPERITQQKIKQKFTFNEVKNNKLKYKNVYLIKNFSILRLLYYRLWTHNHVVMDINDPIHLRQHSGKFGYIKCCLMFIIANHLVFESVEYAKFWKRFNYKITVIEDTPQKKWSGNIKIKEDIVLWYGSKETFKQLVQYSKYIKSLFPSNFRFVFLGIDATTLKLYFNNLTDPINYEEYNSDILFGWLERAKFAICVMPNEDQYTLRGNLKAKLAIAFGCKPILTDIAMHRRLTDNFGGGYYVEETTLPVKKISFNKTEVSKISTKLAETFNIDRHIGALESVFPKKD